MTMRVFDASAAIKVLVAEDGSERAAELVRNTAWIVAPDLVIAETTNVLWKKHKRGEVYQSQAMLAIEQLVSLFDELLPATTLAARSFEIRQPPITACIVGFNPPVGGPALCCSMTSPFCTDLFNSRQRRIPCPK